jgi:hypothetical protein
MQLAIRPVCARVGPWDRCSFGSELVSGDAQKRCFLLASRARLALPLDFIFIRSRL